MARYSKMANKELSFNTGVGISHKAGSNVTLNGSIGTNINLFRQRKGFTGSIDYMGAFAYDSGEKRDVKPYVLAGISINLTPNSAVNANVGWQETDYQKDSIQTALSYSYHW